MFHRILSAALALMLRVTFGVVQGVSPRDGLVYKAQTTLAGVLEKYAKLVGPANEGAVTHSGAVEWPEGV